MELVALAVHTARRIGEVGFAIGALGALIITLGAWTGAAGRTRGNPATAGGAFLVAVGFVLGIVALHWG
jgi:hypothetical protein